MPVDYPLSADSFEQQLRELPAFRALLRAVEARFYATLPLPKPVLDLGCGDGHFATVAFPHGVDVGLDPWWKPLQEARTRQRYGLLTHATGAAMPFAAHSFATVISNSVLEHIPQVLPVLKEVARVLQPGGRFYFCVPGPNFRRFLSVSRAVEALGWRQGAEAYRCLFDRICRHYTYADASGWQQHLEAAGLQLERWWPYFSQGATAALEWGHPLGLPCVLVKALTGRWILVPTRWNLALTAALLRRFEREPLPAEGAYLFFVACKPLSLPI